MAEVRRLDVEASLAAASAASAGQLEEMSRCLEGAYAKIEALQHQTRILNEEANVLSEENDRLTQLVSERDETVHVLREQVQELGNTVVQLENERQNNDFSAHMLSVDQAMQNRTYQRLKRGMPQKSASPVQHAKQREPREPTLSPEPVRLAQTRAHVQMQAPRHVDDGPEDANKLRQQREKLVVLQQEGMLGLDTAITTIEAKLDASIAETRHISLQSSAQRPYYPPVG